MADDYQKPEEKKEKKVLTLDEAYDDIIQCLVEYIEEGERALDSDRRQRNKRNWDSYLGRMDWSDKEEGQSTVFLHKTALAAEQLTSMFKASTVNFDKFISVERLGDPAFSEDERDVFNEIFTNDMVSAIVRFYLEEADIKTALGDAFKLGLFEVRSTIKVTGAMYPKTHFVMSNRHGLRRKTDMQWCLRLDCLPALDYIPDPEGAGLYEWHRMTLDKSTVRDYARTDDNPDGLYLEEAIEKLTPDVEEDKEQEKKESRGEDTTVSNSRRRFRVTLYEGWIDKICSQDGEVMRVIDEDGSEQELRNVMVTISKSKRCWLQKPEANPNWSADSPFVSVPLLRTPNAVWGKSLMDAAVDLNEILSEMFSLMIDGALAAIHNVRIVRPDLFEDPASLDGGFIAGRTYRLRAGVPAGVSPAETLQLGELPNDLPVMFNIAASALAENVMSNQITLGGLPQKQVRATEVVSASQSITSIFDNIAAEYEDKLVEPLVSKAWMLILQNIDKFPEEDLVRMLGGDAANRKRVEALNQLSPEQRYRIAAKGFKFRGVGMKSMAERMKDFQRITQLLATIGTSPELLQAFQQKMSLSRLLEKIVKSLGINSDEIAKTEEEIAMEQQIAMIREQAMIEQELAGQPQSQQGAGPESAPAENIGEASIPEGTEPGSGQGIA